MREALRRARMKYVVTDWHKKWSVWVAAFWGVVGALIVILSALFYQAPDWRIGLALIIASASMAIARVLKRPGAV